VSGRPTGDPESRDDGHAFSSAALGGYRLTAGRPPARAGEVALDGLPPGARVDVLTAAGPDTWTVSGTIAGPGFYVADDVAARMSAGVRMIGLVVDGDPGAVVSAASSVAGREDVLSGDRRAAAEPESVTRVRWIGAQLMIAMVALGAFAAIFVVGSTCALSAAQRRREIGLLRAVGATPGQVRRLMYAETLVLAALAGLVGAPLGTLAALPMAGPLIRSGMEPAGFTVTVQPLALAVAYATGIVVALAGVWSVARRAARIPALDALREAAVEKRAMTPVRWVAGLLGLAGGLALLAAVPSLPVDTQSTAGLGAAMLLLTAAALLAPVVIVPLVRLVTWPWRRAATGMLVREGTLTGARRVASTAAPVLLTVGFAVLLTGTVATVEEVAGIDETAKIPAATVAVPDGAPGLSEAVVAAQPGSSRLSTTVHLGRFPYRAVGAGDALVLSSDTAAETGLRAGDPVEVRWPDGETARLRVAAVRPDADAAVVLPRAEVRVHDPGALTDLVVLDGPAVPAPGLRTMSVRDHVTMLLDREGRLIDVFLAVLVGLTVGYSLLAVANTLLMATAARRPEFRALRLAGAGTGQVLRVAAAEALLAVAAGTLLGAAVAGISLTGVQRAVEAELNRQVPLVVPWPAAAAVTVACAAIALAATAVPLLRRRGIVVPSG
jgi:putative ABC transport system permease protein